MKEKVVVAMSGGVDSSVAAALLRDGGYEVIGMTMALSREEDDAPDSPGCSWQTNPAEDARRVAKALGISHETVDFSVLFRDRVISDFLSEYAGGRTPNPCIVCNRELKFGALWQRAQEIGASHIATGHYVRVMREGNHAFLRKGSDSEKDQSYMLYRVRKEVLPHILMPLGEYRKDDVRKMAEAYGLPVAHKPESQEICFVPKDDYRAYLREKRPECLKRGDIVDTSGHILGHHSGACLYTVGQRRGLGIAAAHPLYVLRIDAEKNRVIVGKSEEVYANGLTAFHMNWHIPEGTGMPERVMAKIRYGKREAEARIHPLPGGRYRVEFSSPQRAVAPGQSVVFYDGDILIGGGIIENGIP